MFVSRTRTLKRCVCSLRSTSCAPQLFYTPARFIGRYFNNDLGLEKPDDSAIQGRRAMVDAIENLRRQQEQRLDTSDLPMEDTVKRQEIYNKLRSEGRKVRKDPSMILAKAMDYKRSKDSECREAPTPRYPSSNKRTQEPSIDDVDLSSIDLSKK